MIVKQVTLPNPSKDKLSRLKGKTGIQHWNVLCRWALCFSLAEKTIPADIDQPADSNLEITWHTFTGENNNEIYEALIKARCKADGLLLDEETLAKYFRLHLNRGIAYMAATNVIRSLDDLLYLSVKTAEANEK